MKNATDQRSHLQGEPTGWPTDRAVEPELRRRAMLAGDGEGPKVSNGPTENALICGLATFERRVRQKDRKRERREREERKSRREALRMGEVEDDRSDAIAIGDAGKKIYERHAICMV